MTASEYDDLKRFVEDYEPEQENTMTELKPCPFCGKTEHLEIVKREDSKHPKHYLVTCDITSGGCGGIGGYRFTKQEAIEAWNMRYEPTCKYEIDQVPEGGPVYTTCTNCGWQTDIDYIPMPKGFNYCPNCGAKVIEE